MPPGRKEKDVLARQKQLAAMMAAKRKPKPGLTSTAKNDTRSRKRGAAAAAAAVTAATSSSVVVATNNKRPRIRGRTPKPKPPSDSSSSVIDLTESEAPSSSATASGKSRNPRKEKQVIMGIHKSFKRPSASSVMAAARAKALKLKQSDTDGTVDGEKDKDQKKGAKRMKTSNTTDDKDTVAKTSSKRRLASLVTATTSSTTTGNKEDWSLAATSITPDDFWKNIRKWDFVVQLAKLQLQNRDETNDKDQYNKVVPDSFINSRHYVSVWAPLCLAECRAQLMSEIVTECGQKRGGRNASPFILVDVQTTWKTGRNNHRDSIPGAEYFSEISDFCQVMLKIPDSERRSNKHGRLQFFPNDICCLVPVDKKDVVENLLFRGNGGGGGGGRRGGAGGENNRFNVEDADSDVFKHACIVGHCETHRKEVHGLILKISKRKWAQVGSCKSSGKSGSGGQMYMLRIGCNITALREFTALACVDKLPLKHYLLGKQLGHNDNSQDHKRKKRKLGNNSNNSSKGSNAIPDPRHTNKDSLLKMMGGVDALGKGFTDYATKKFNPSQLMAISASSQGYGDGGFTLIKGPPGTGKTTTLVNILNALHIRQFNKYYDEVRKIVAIQTGNRQTALEIARRAKPRLLVCAPSNAAVDNVILKIMEEGFIDGSGQRYNPSITRIGSGQSTAVKDVALETKVDQILTDNSDHQQLENSIAGFRMELQRITTDIVKCRKRIHAITNASPWPLGRHWEIRVEEDSFDETGRVFFVNHKDHSTSYECPPPPEPGEKQFHARNMPEYRAFMSRTVKLVESYFSIKSNLEQSTIVKGLMGNGARHFEVKQNLELHVLNSVHIVMTTLGTAGNRVLSDGVDKFEVVVVDEAAQSVEPATLAALQLGSRHCVMVGDPQQLPATIFNLSGKNSKYDRSLFQRLEEAGEKVYMLNEQYRMHPQISHFPRHIFYKGALKDGPNVRKKDYGNPLVEMITSRVKAFQPFTVLDLDSKEERGGTSLSNSTEADLALYLYDSLKKISNGLSATSRVAVITPYAQQANLLRRKFGDLLGENYAKFVEVNTVDAFQGREAKIVIFSAVRAAGSHGIGFLSDVRRMNVALTRAKNFLFVIARCKSITVNPYWKDLVEHARDTNAVVTVPILQGPKKGRTQFSPFDEWGRKRDLPSQPLPAEGASFKDQLTFFKNMPSNFIGPGAPAPPPPPPHQPQSHFQNNAPLNSSNNFADRNAPAPPVPPPPPQPQPYFQNNAPPNNSNNFVGQSAPAPFQPQQLQPQPYFQNNAQPNNNFVVSSGPTPHQPQQPQPQPYFQNNAPPNNSNNFVGQSGSAPPQPPPPQQQPYFSNNSPLNNSNNFVGQSAPAPPQPQPYFPNNAPPNNSNNLVDQSAPAPPPPPPPQQQQQPYFPNNAPPNGSNSFVGQSAPLVPPQPQPYLQNVIQPPPPNFPPQYSVVNNTSHGPPPPPPPAQPPSFNYGGSASQPPPPPPPNSSDPRIRATAPGNANNDPRFHNKKNDPRPRKRKHP